MKENQICEHFYIWYLKECLLEEVGFRGFILGIVLPLIHLGGWTGVILSTIVYALAHFVLYSWQMVVVCIPFGLFLGSIYLWLLSIFDFSHAALIVVFICLGVHFGIAAGAYQFMYFKELEKKWRKR